ncbi:hypothetical protein F2Q70_00026281 [Brassica cretica]|uniref:Uncharacterized protein n=3 Tax=Brassica cretica TaxID=69181 RepID=A0A8S9L8L9_BRACR|nr:hypothetical protein F2Q70_00026281 [Brassica cretica]
MKLMKKGTDHHNQEKKDHEIGFFSLDVEAMEAEIEKLVVTKTRENQENDKEISGLSGSASPVKLSIYVSPVKLFAAASPVSYPALRRCISGEALRRCVSGEAFRRCVSGKLSVCVSVRYIYII